MKIILTVNFSDKKFNNDYKLSVSMLAEHSVLLVTDEKQLKSACPFYDILIIGQSSFLFDKGDLGDIKVIHALDDTQKTIALIDN